MNKAEKHIIEIALEKVKNEEATEEQKIIVQLYNANSLRESLDCVYNTIKPLNTRDKTIKETFENFEYAIQRTYNTLYEYCGYSYQYTVANIIEYIQDFLVEKIDNSLKNNPSKKFMLLTSISVSACSTSSVIGVSSISAVASGSVVGVATISAGSTIAVVGAASISTVASDVVTAGSTGFA